MKDLEIEEGKTLKEVVDDARASVQFLNPNEEIVFVGYQMHFVVGGTMASIASWTEGFMYRDHSI